MTYAYNTIHFFSTNYLYFYNLFENIQILSFLTNLLRSLFLTGWAYAYGSEAIEGNLHDVTGFAVLGLTVAGLLAFLPLLNPVNWRRWLGVAARPH